MPSSGWNTATASRQKAPIYIVRLDGYSGQFATGDVKNESIGTQKYLRAPSLLSQSVDPVTGRYTVGAARFSLTDKTQNVTILLATEHPSPILSTILNRGVTILLGYSGLDEADYAPVFRGAVTDLKLARDLASYDFVCGTPNRKTLDDIFTAADAGGARVSTQIEIAASVGDQRIYVDTVANILPDDYLFLGKNGSGEEEKVQVRSVRADSFQIKAPIQHAYGVDTPVRWATTRLRGNPINIWYSLLTGTFSTGGSFPLVSFDGAPTGLGVAASDIDTTALAAERDDFLWGLEMSFEVRQRERAKDFFEKQIFRLFGVPITTLEGKLSFRAFRPARPTEVITLDEDSIVSVVEWTRAFEHSYNRILIRDSYDAERDAYLRDTVHEDTTDQAATGIRELLIEHRGLFGMDSMLNEIRMEDYAKRFLRRYMKGAPTVRVRTHLTKRALQLGDAVEFGHPALPNVRAGRGIAYGPSTPKYQVIDISPLDDDAQVEITLQEDGFQRPMWVATSGQPDFGAATTDQKRRWYISPPAGANFSDATRPYTVI